MESVTLNGLELFLERAGPAFEAYAGGDHARALAQAVADADTFLASSCRP